MQHVLRLTVFSLALAALPASAQTAAPVELRILAINDFHGNLRPPPGGIRISDPEDKARKVMVAAGGAEYMATLVKQLREGHKNTIFVAAGDLIGASPFLSAMFHDEPSIESLSMMGLAISSVGNHEFDEGKTELLRMQNGGCHPVDGCQGPHSFTGARFRYLAASTIETATGKSVLPPYEIREFEGIPIAFIGLTLKDTAGIVSPSGITGLEFRDEAETVNALVPQLKAGGVEAIVVLIHQGGEPAGDYNECPAITGPIVDIVKKIDRAVDLVVSGHTHRAYVCDIDGRLVTSGDKYGTLVTAIDLKLDPATRDIVSARAENVLVANASLPRDPEQTALIDAYDRLSAPIANRPAGSVTQTLSRVPNEAGESPLGDVIADAQLAATRDAKDGSAVIALTNPGGIRTDIVPKENGAITFGDVFASQAVPQPARHHDAHGQPAQGHAGAAMARSEAAADSPGLERVQLRLGCGEAIRRARDQREDDAQWQADRSRKRLPRHPQRLPRSRGRRVYGRQTRHGAAIWRLRR
ncbi:5'-nucleotidase [Bradyrhizobium sp. GM0.4]